MEIRILGPLEVVTSTGGVMTATSPNGVAENLPSQPKARALVILLAERTGFVVPRERILNVLWGPARADKLSDPANAVQKVVVHVRKAIAAAGGDGGGQGLLKRVEGGYRLEDSVELEIDLKNYRVLLQTSSSAANPVERAHLLEQATALWRGDPPDILKETQDGEALWRRLRSLRITGEERLLDAQIAIGTEPDTLLERTTELASNYPEHGPFVRQAMTALAELGHTDTARDLFDAYKIECESRGDEPSVDVRNVLAQLTRGTATKAGPRPQVQPPTKQAEPFDADAAIGVYLTRVINSSRRLRFGDATRAADEVPDQGGMTLDKVWTPIQVALQPKDKERLESKTEEMAAIEALDQREYRRVVLLGNPGGGKSTIVAYRTWTLASAALAGSVSRTVPVPIHVRLPALTPDSEKLSTDDLWAGVHEILHEDSRDTRLVSHLSGLLQTGQASLLFDGLDEVQEELLPGVLKLIALCDSEYPDCSVVSTCRKFDYEIEQPRRRLPYPALELLPFELPQQLEYVEHWYDALAFWDYDPQLEERKRNLQRTLEDNPHLVEMGSTPLLTALMTLVHTQDGELPEARATLYRRAIQHLLAETALWRERSGGSTIAGQDMIILAGRVGYEFHRRQEFSTNEFRGLPEHELREIVSEHFKLYNTQPGTLARKTAQERVDAHTLRLIQSNGLLVHQGAGFYDFTFKQYREFLAGFYLGTIMDDPGTLECATRPHWRECFKLLASHAAGTDTNIGYILYFINELADVTRPEPMFGPPDAVLAAEMLQEIGREKLISLNQDRVLTGAPSHGLSGLWPRIAASLLPFLSRETSGLSASLRIRAALALGGLGDLRFVDSNGEPTPLTSRVVNLNAGRFAAGTDHDAATGRRVLDEASTSRRIVKLGEYGISRYLTTNGEFIRFVGDGGYSEPRWWSTEEADRWRAGDIDFVRSLERLWVETAEENYALELTDGTYTLAGLEETAAELCRTRQQPFFFSNTRFNASNQPVVGVNFWEARAYCAWLTQRGQQAGWLDDDQVVRLPTEWEWERATSPTGDPRLYPWGADWNPNAARTRHDGTELAHASPVGCYPNGTWADGPLDLAGNVWEWTASRLLSYDERFDVQRDEPGGLSERAIRGSSWYDSKAIAHTQCASRYLDLPGNVYFDLGFRVVLSGRDVDPA